MYKEYLKKRVELIQAIKKLPKIIKKKKEEYPCDLPDKLLELINDSEEYISLSLDNNAFLSYAQKPDDIFSYKRRKSCRIGSFLAKKFGDDYHDWVLDHYRNELVALLRENMSLIRIISGNEIVTAYEKEVGGHSCMTGENSSLIEFYAKSKKCRLLIFDDGDLQARALLWDTDCGRIFVDRIYPNYGYHIAYITNYAHQNGWLTRSHNNNPFRENGEEVFILDKDGKHYDISVTTKNHDQYPFLDTLSYTSDLDSKDIILHSNYVGHTYVLHDTDGDYRYRCKECSQAAYEHYHIPDINAYYCERHFANISYYHCKRCENRTLNKGQICNDCL